MCLELSDDILTLAVYAEIPAEDLYGLLQDLTDSKLEWAWVNCADEASSMTEGRILALTVAGEMTSVRLNLNLDGLTHAYIQPTLKTLLAAA